MSKFQLFRNGALVHTAYILRESVQAAEHEARTILRAPSTAVDERALRESGVILAIIVADVTLATLTLRPSSESSSGAYVDRADWEGIERPSVRFNPEDEDERSVDEAMGILRRSHARTVSGVAGSILSRVASGEIEDSAGLSEAIHEDCDGHSDVIYTFKAKLLLLVSDNEDAYEQEFGETENASVEARACVALTADVRDELERADGPDDWRRMGLSDDEVRALVCGGTINGPFDQTDDDTYPASLQSPDAYRDTIIERAARTLYCDSWARAVEGAPEGADVPNLSGCEIMDHAPATSEKAMTAARDLVLGLERANNRTTADAASLGLYFRKRIFPDVRAADEYADDDATALDFGFCLAMEFLGHGVAWTDSHKEHGLTVRHGEYNEEHEFPAKPDAEGLEVGEYDGDGGNGCAYGIVERDGAFYFRIGG